jgi:hypothetical protein
MYDYIYYSAATLSAQGVYDITIINASATFKCTIDATQRVPKAQLLP